MNCFDCKNSSALAVLLKLFSHPGQQRKQTKSSPTSLFLPLILLNTPRYPWKPLREKHPWLLNSTTNHKPASWPPEKKRWDFSLFYEVLWVLFFFSTETIKDSQSQGQEDPNVGHKTPLEGLSLTIIVEYWWKIMRMRKFGLFILSLGYFQFFIFKPATVGVTSMCWFEAKGNKCKNSFRLVSYFEFIGLILSFLFFILKLRLICGRETSDTDLPQSTVMVVLLIIFLKLLVELMFRLAFSTNFENH